MSGSRKRDTNTGAIERAPVRIGGPSVAYVRWADLRRSSAARRQVRAARELARRLRRAA